MNCIKDYKPDYTNIIQAATNQTPNRTPLYEHIIAPEIMEKIMNTSFIGLEKGSFTDKQEYFRQYCDFFKRMGYDTVSYECCVGEVMPGSGALGGHKEGVIKTRADFEKYPWDAIPDLYFEAYMYNFNALKSVMPEGMRAVGGPGNGVFECVQDVVGYTNLCYISFDDPELYRDLFTAVGGMLVKIWELFLDRYSELYAVLRFGDDLGFKNQTLIAADDIKTHIIPQYTKIIQRVHGHDKPFLLHSCGKIFEVMEDIINIAKINAKHSNEDQIAPFSTWLDQYGDRIGNFGGIDMDILCQLSEVEIKDYVTNVMHYAKDKGGVAIGSGNSIPDYVPVEGYLAMVEAANAFRIG